MKIEKPQSHARKKRREGLEETVPNLSPSGRDDGTVKRHAGQTQLSDCLDAGQKMKNISLPENARNFPCRRRSGRVVTCIDLSSFEEGFCRAQRMLLKHPSQLHIMVHGHSHANWKRSKMVTEEFNDSEEYLPHYPSGPLLHDQARERGSWNNTIIKRDRQLNSQTFQQCLENLWQSFPEEKRKSFTSFDSLWYLLYMYKSYKEKVLGWVKKKDIFSRKYVIVPIVQSGHWSLMIFCHFGESLDSRTRTPCILLLDSLQKAEPQQLEPGIRRFVLDIYRTEERPVNEKQLLKVPFLVPKVPQQRNGDECGFYVLYYTSLFVKSAPHSFSVSEGYPYFMTKNWFTVQELDCFCRTLDSSCN